MPDAEDIRLQSAYERALRANDAASASSLLQQIELRNQQQIANTYGVRFAPEDYDVETHLEQLHELRSQGIDPADFDDAEDIAASTGRQINRGQFVEPPSQFQSFLNNINTQSLQGARIQELVNKNPKLAEKIFNTSVGLGSKAFKAQKKLAGINDSIYQAAENLKAKYQRGDFIPGFISKPLGLKNPLVKAGGIVTGGTQLNPEGIRFLQEQKDLGGILNRSHLDAMGGHVLVNYSPEAFIGKNTLGPKLDIAFQSATGYSDPTSIKKGKADAAAQLQRLEAELNSQVLLQRDNKALNKT